MDLFFKIWNSFERNFFFDKLPTSNWSSLSSFIHAFILLVPLFYLQGEIPSFQKFKYFIIFWKFQRIAKIMPLDVWYHLSGCLSNFLTIQEPRDANTRSQKQLQRKWWRSFHIWVFWDTKAWKNRGCEKEVNLPR